MACSTWASAKWPIRHLAMTGIDTAAMMPSIMSGSLILATPPWARMSAGTLSRAITATAPASSAILAWSGVTTSMMTPPLSISAIPRLTRAVPVTVPPPASGPIASAPADAGRPAERRSNRPASTGLSGSFERSVPAVAVAATAGPLERGEAGSGTVAERSWLAAELTVDTRKPRLLRDVLTHNGRSAGSLAGWARQAAVPGNGRVVDLEELGEAGVAGQAEQPHQGTLAGLPGDRDRVVVEPAGEVDLAGGGLELRDQLVRAVLAIQRGAEPGLGERGAQRACQVALGKLPRPLPALEIPLPLVADAPCLVGRPGEQQARRRVEQPGRCQLQGHRAAPDQGEIQRRAGRLEPRVQPVEAAGPPGDVEPQEDDDRDDDDNVGEHRNPPPPSVSRPPCWRRVPRSRTR